MRMREEYEKWNTERRERFPDANHGAWSSEQRFELGKGFELVADWDTNYIRDKETSHDNF